MPLIWVAVGLYLSMASFSRQAEAQLAESPDTFVSGTARPHFSSSVSSVAASGEFSLVPRSRSSSPG
jgi:hypothetical protein